jgi:hypothetical protein
LKIVFNRTKRSFENLEGQEVIQGLFKGANVALITANYMKDLEGKG